MEVAGIVGVGLLLAVVAASGVVLACLCRLAHRARAMQTERQILLTPRRGPVIVPTV